MFAALITCDESSGASRTYLQCSIQPSNAGSNRRSRTSPSVSRTLVPLRPSCTAGLLTADRTRCTIPPRSSWSFSTLCWCFLPSRHVCEVSQRDNTSTMATTVMKTGEKPAAAAVVDPTDRKQPAHYRGFVAGIFSGIAKLSGTCRV